MINTIKLFYSSKTLEEKEVVGAFFKMAGFHIIEECYDEPVDLSESLASLKIKPILNTGVISTAKIILTDNLGDKQLKQLNIADNIIIDIKSKDLQKVKPTVGGKGKLINRILGLLSKKNLLNEKHKGYLCELAEIFIGENYTVTDTLANCASLFQERHSTMFVIERQKKFVNKTFEKWKVNKENIYIGYALVMATYITNQLCRKVGSCPIYSDEVVVTIANELKGMGDGLLDNSISRLLIKIPTNPTEIYDRLCEASTRENIYNSSFQHSRGLFCMRYRPKGAGHVDALRCFATAISLSPNNYELWYSLGTCFLKTRDSENAFIAFSTTVNILKKNHLNPVEKHFLVRSATETGLLLEQQCSYLVALEYYRLAKETLEGLKKSRYVKKMIMEANKRGVSEASFAHYLEPETLKCGIENCKTILQ